MNIHTLSCHAVSKSFIQGPLPIMVLNEVTVTFCSDVSYAITGISGSGKSTLLHLLAGLDVPTSGTITYDEADIFAWPESKKNTFLNKSIGLLFQYPYLVKELSLLENVILKGLISGKTVASCTQEATELLTEVGLENRLHAYPGELSGGQQQRVALARALMNQPAFLLADEPTGNLDMQTGQMVLDLLVTLQKRWQLGLIVSTHDPIIAGSMHTIYELHHGSLLLKKGERV